MLAARIILFQAHLIVLCFSFHLNVLYAWHDHRATRKKYVRIVDMRYFVIHTIVLEKSETNNNNDQAAYEKRDCNADIGLDSC